ncbi:hypothetical protein AY601_0815 [Pedobacter cryoconitis]|uniref:Uncharacterized protein n=1 Tax=Pedobacter cryoconitis TaxID=188932 RepID=A0A127V959_9SPHI|nr:hypothetical protein AY601_0815 [Pedobacter cryoconitis]
MYINNHKLTYANLIRCKIPFKTTYKMPVKTNRQIRYNFNCNLIKQPGKKNIAAVMKLIIIYDTASSQQRYLTN